MRVEQVRPLSGIISPLTDSQESLVVIEVRLEYLGLQPEYGYGFWTQDQQSWQSLPFTRITCANPFLDAQITHIVVAGSRFYVYVQNEPQGFLGLEQYDMRLIV